MVQVRALQPINTDGSINLEGWLDHVLGMDPALDRDALKQACEFARTAEQQANAAQNLWSEGTSSYQTGLEIAEILADLKLDQDSLVAAVIYRGVREGKIQLADVHQQFGPVVAKLIDGAKKHHLFADEGDGIYDRLDRLREVRNRIHIQNSNAKLERDELDVYTEERQKEAERAVEGVLRQMATKHQRSTNAQGYVGELELPWEPYDPSGTM